MNRFLLLAGLFAALVSTTSAFAQSGPFDQTPSPTVVYGDLVTVGSAPLDDSLNNHWQLGTGSQG